jgi:hypothetical protein
MHLDATRLDQLLGTLHPGKLSPTDADTIVSLAQLSVDADDQEDSAEIRLLSSLGKAVFKRAGLDRTPRPELVDAADDADARMHELARKLGTPHAREVAYAVAHLLAISDISIAPAEDRFLVSLRSALAIDPARADEIAALAGASITPGT